MRWEDIADVLQLLNPNLEADAATRYANVLMDEAVGKRYPTVRRVMQEALRWRPVKEETG